MSHETLSQKQIKNNIKSPVNYLQLQFLFEKETVDRWDSKNYLWGTQKSLSLSKVSLDMLMLSARCVRRPGANAEPHGKHGTNTAALPLPRHTHSCGHTPAFL